jgi:bile acid:Na+ symporter, BASS family
LENLANIIMPASIALIMFGIGLELKFKDFRRVFTEPKAILLGLSCQVILLPIIALGLVYFWPIKPIYKIGIMLVAACPGGTASNLVTKMLKGKVALSVSLTAFNSFIILFTIPLIVGLSYDLFGSNYQALQLGFWETMQEVLITVVVPVLLGILIAGIMTDAQQKKIHKPLNYILPVILIFAVITVVFFDKTGKNINYSSYLPLFIPLILLNICTIMAGFYTARKFRLKHESAYTIAIEMGLQNSVLALFIGNQLLKNQDISLIAILYGSFSLLTTFGIAYILKMYAGDQQAKN